MARGEKSTDKGYLGMTMLTGISTDDKECDIQPMDIMHVLFLYSRHLISMNSFNAVTNYYCRLLNKNGG